MLGLRENEAHVLLDCGLFDPDRAVYEGKATRIMPHWRGLSKGSRMKIMINLRQEMAAGLSRMYGRRVP